MFRKVGDLTSSVEALSTAQEWGSGGRESGAANSVRSQRATVGKPGELMQLPVTLSAFPGGIFASSEALFCGINDVRNSTLQVPSSRRITPRKFSRGVIVIVAYSFKAPDSVSSWARTARRTARFTTARFRTARLTARRFTAFLTMRRFTTARLTARLFTAFLTTRLFTARFTTARLTARFFKARLATALFTAFFAKLPSLNPSRLRPRSGLATRPQDVADLLVSSADILVQLRDLSPHLFRIASAS